MIDYDSDGGTYRDGNDGCGIDISDSDDGDGDDGSNVDGEDSEGDASGGCDEYYVYSTVVIAVATFVLFLFL